MLNSIIDFEKKAVESYKKAITLSRAPIDIIQDVSECSEAVFKSICIRDYGKKPTDPAINKPIPFLMGKGFFGKFYKVDIMDRYDPSKVYTTKDEFGFDNPKLEIIKKYSENINALGNPKKHAVYSPTEDEISNSLAAIRTILKWYFKEKYDYEQIKMSVDESIILRSLFHSHESESFEWEKRDKEEHKQLEEKYYTREQVCKFLYMYYENNTSNLKPYKFSIDGGETQNTTIFTSENLCDKEIKINPNTKLFHFNKENSPYKSSPNIKQYAGHIKRKIKKFDIDIWDDPSFRLIEFSDLNNPIVFSKVNFFDYRYSSGILEDELIDRIIKCEGNEKVMMMEKDKMLIRNELLPNLLSIMPLKNNRICGGGLGVLLAIKEGDQYTIRVQKRSSVVSDGRGKYALFPKGFHQPFDEMNFDIEVNLFHTIMKELYEEALCKNKREEKNAYNYNWYYDRSLAMKWVNNHPSDVTTKLTSFGFNAINGNYDFGILLVIDNEEFNDLYRVERKKNWEIGGIKEFSSKSTETMIKLITEEEWTNESLFHFVEGLKALEKHSPKFVSIPKIDLKW